MSTSTMTAPATALLREPAKAPPETEAVPATAEAAPPAVAGAETPQIEQKTRDRGPAKKVALGILVLFGVILGYHVLTDYFAPTSSTGSVAAMTVQLAPRVAGEVETIFVADNQMVKKGEPLFALDSRPFDLTIRQAEAALGTALQTVDASALSLDALRAKITQAEANLETMQAAADRAQTLFDKGLTSRAQYDTAQSQLTGAVTALEGARVDLRSNEARLGAEGASNPQVAAAQVQLEQAQLNRQFSTIVAPADGLITNLKLAIGQYVNAGSPALTFIEAEKPWITVDLRENQLANLEVGDTASILFDAVPGRTYRAVVKGIAWGIDPGRTTANGLPQNLSSTRWFEPARSIPVQLELAEGEEWPRHVRVGSKASALIYSGGEASPVAWVASGIQTVKSIVSILF